MEEKLTKEEKADYIILPEMDDSNKNIIKTESLYEQLKNMEQPTPPSFTKEKIYPILKKVFTKK